MYSAKPNLLHSSMNQQLFEKYLKNQGSHYEKYRKWIWMLCRKPSCATTTSTLFTVSKDKWEDTGKSIKDALFVL